jgi:hypothetical protein
MQKLTLLEKNSSFLTFLIIKSFLMTYDTTAKVLFAFSWREKFEENPFLVRSCGEHQALNITLASVVEV